MKPIIGMIGHGAFGTAVAMVLARNGYTVRMWCYEAEDVAAMEQSRSNRYLPGVTLSPLIEPTADMALVVKDAQTIFQAIPVKYLRTILEQAKPYITHGQQWVSLSKGIEQDSLFFPTQLITQVLGDSVTTFACAGPSFAVELANNQPTGLTVAGGNAQATEHVASLLRNGAVRVDTTNDLIGVELSGAAKNVAALGVGLLDGAGYQDNSKALFLTRVFAELKQFAQAVGADPVTFDGLSGFGDLVLSCMGSKSRNREVGVRLGAGESLESVVEKTGYIPEGINTMQSVMALQKKYQIDLPVLQAVYRVIAQGQKVAGVLAVL